MWLNCDEKELCIYLRGLEGACLPISSLATTNASAQLKLTPIAPRSCKVGRRTVSIPGFQYGMMSELSKDFPGGDSLTSWRAAFHAKIFHLLEKVLGLKGNTLAFGGKCGESLAKYDPKECLWKTRQYSLAGGLETFSETFPRWGMMQNGELYRVPTPSGLIAHRERQEYIMNASASLFLPTVMAACVNGGQTCRSGDRKDELLLAAIVKKLPTVTCEDSQQAGSRKHSPTLYSSIVKPQNMPTVQSHNRSMPGKKSIENGGRHADLVVAVMRERERESNQNGNGDTAGLQERKEQEAIGECAAPERTNWWGFEPHVARVVHGLAFRIHRIRAIGNGQDPKQVALAWWILNGFDND
jgi:hypothetical protein